MYRLPPRLLATLVLPAVPLAAQEVPLVAPTPTATPTPSPSPILAPSEPIVLPTPEPTPTPRATTTLTPRPSPRPVASPSPTPVPSATPTAAPSPQPSAGAAPPSVIASPLPTADDRSDGGSPAWPWMLGASVLLLGGIGLWLARRRRTSEDEEVEVAAPPEDPTPAMPPAYLTPTVASTSLVLRFRPTRVGFNMLSATAEGELTVANEGPAPAAGLRIRAGLLGAHAGQEADMAGFLAQPMGRPVVPVFDLAPGERRTVRVVAAVPREAMRTLTAAGRPMFVPVLTADVRDADGTQVAQGFAIGAERVDSAKLAPFWLDVPDRGYTAVAAREHGPAVVRGGRQTNPPCRARPGIQGHRRGR